MARPSAGIFARAAGHVFVFNLNRRRTVNRSIALLLLGGTLAAFHPQPAASQSQTRTVPGTRGMLGFVYSGPPDFSRTPPHFSDFPIVRHVYETSPAEAAGLRAGDVILKVNGREGCEMQAYFQRTPGTRYTLTVQRGHEQKEISFVLVAPTWPDSAWAPTASRR